MPLRLHPDPGPTLEGAANLPRFGDEFTPVTPLAPAPGPVVPVEYLRPGDFTGGRVVRGDPARDPWRLELLAREGEFVWYGFEVEEAARIALDLLERRSVMRLARDDEGRPFAPSTEQFEEARRRHDETERLLALGEEGEGSQPLH